MENEVKMVTVKVTGGKTQSPLKPTVNGRTIVVPYNQEVEIPEPFLAALQASDRGAEVQVIDAPKPADAETTIVARPDSELVAPGLGVGTTQTGLSPEDAKTALEQDAATGGEPTGDAEGGQDADALIEGTVPDVVARLADLDADQLDAAEAAENDREQPRQGVLKAIEAARGKLAA